MDVGVEQPSEGSHLLREAPGRETWLVVAGSQRWIEKRFVGGEPCEAWRERLRGQSPRSPARREYDALLALRAAGVPVPEALACEESGRRSSLRMGFIPHTETFRDRLGRVGAAERRALGRRLLDLVLHLHHAGWYHRDLYLEHFVIRADTGDPCLIDLGRARRDRATRERWFEKDLAALAHSAPATVTDRERLRFLAGYLDGRGITARLDRRRRARGVLRRAGRMARHEPRHGISHPLPAELGS